MLSLHLPNGLVPHHVEVLQSRRMGISTHEWSLKLHFQGGYFTIGGLHKKQVSALRKFLESKFLPMLRKIEGTPQQPLVFANGAKISFSPSDGEKYRSIAPSNEAGTCSGGPESPGTKGDVEKSE